MAGDYEITDEDLNRLEESEVDQVLVQAATELPEFVQFLGDQVLSTELVTLLDVVPNVTMPSLGETDVQVRVRRPDGTVLGLLLEDKVRAPASPPMGGVPQDERYLLRGRRGVEKGAWRDFRTCLCAPQKYLDSRFGESAYQSALSHERLQEWFEACPHPRAGEWARVMATSIESCRRGWVPILDDNTHGFSLDYWNYLRSHHPGIEMAKPDVTTRDSLWKYLRFPGMPGKNIVHKFNRVNENSIDSRKPESPCRLRSARTSPARPRAGPSGDTSLPPAVWTGVDSAARTASSAGTMWPPRSTRGLFHHFPDHG